MNEWVPLYFDCSHICHYWQIFFKAGAVKRWLLCAAPCSYIVNKGFLLFLISSALPPSTFCLWLVVRSLHLEPGWPAPHSGIKAGCRWKIYDCAPCKPHMPFEALRFLWCCPHRQQLHLRLLTVGVWFTERVAVSKALHSFTSSH